MKTLFITRKYPPSTGGMESLSYHLTTHFPEPKTILAMRKVHQMHLVWFIPYAIVFLLIRGWRYDVIHLSDLVLGALGWIGKIILRKRVYITIHGLDFTYGEGNAIPQRVFRFYMWLMQRLPTYDRLFSNSVNTKKMAERRGLKKIEAIPLGISLPIVHDALLGMSVQEILPAVSDAPFYLLTTGRLVKRKGVRWFLEHVFLHLPSHIQYVIVGPLNWRKNENESERIQQWIQEHDLTTRVRLAGRVSDATLLRLFRECQVFIMPNIKVPNDVEGFGIVAGEAALAGMPVLAANIEGIPDAIQDGKNGKLLPSGQADAWIDAIKQLIHNPEQRAVMGAKAAEFTCEHYSWDAIARQYESFMKQSA